MRPVAPMPPRGGGGAGIGWPSGCVNGRCSGGGAPPGRGIGAPGGCDGARNDTAGGFGGGAPPRIDGGDIAFDGIDIGRTPAWAGGGRAAGASIVAASRDGD